MEITITCCVQTSMCNSKFTLTEYLNLNTKHNPSICTSLIIGICNQMFRFGPMASNHGNLYTTLLALVLRALHAKVNGTGEEKGENGDGDGDRNG